MKWNRSFPNIPPADQIIPILLANRGLKTREEIANFLSPTDPGDLTPESVGLEKKSVLKAIKRIKAAVKTNEPIVVYGDYDADGICSTAILWEALRDLGAKAMPFIPLREKEGYGLSREGIDTILSEAKYGLTTTPKSSNKRSRKNGLASSKGLVISVDSGIMAHEAVNYAKKKGLDVIIIDHHEKPQNLPKAHTIIHTQSLCAAGISYIFSKELLPPSPSSPAPSLELAAIATITDLMPLSGPNRSIVKYGLELLNKTNRPGLRALFNVAGIEKVGTYEIGFMIGPRLNASGRIENALLALRMLCTSDFTKALEYAQQLNETNKQRQGMMEEMTLHALDTVNSEQRTVNSQQRIIVIEHESYHQGIIGLIAGKLVDKYYLPAIVISKGETVSKASARSISGFNIIEAIRTTSEILLGAGGHPMAAGFSIETARIEEFKTAISKVALEQIKEEMLDRVLRIDCNLDLGQIDVNLYQKIRQFEPFGLGNPEPTFASEVQVQNIRTVGQEGKHLKLTVVRTNQQPATSNQQLSIDCIAFNQGSLASQIKIGDKISIAYTIDLNSFNGHQTLQLKVKDVEQLI
ncbi:MAG: Single-stranded-DNA-specific exonuclease RecJ [Microgenomates group bacterium GW2011_GWA1_48_10]|nr:MAG: Single-stranded-DNA-specific exonuclease RecJ [Microgenomates group bacterium GW2011_GWA1_48_10]